MKECAALDPAGSFRRQFVVQATHRLLAHGDISTTGDAQQFICSIHSACGHRTGEYAAQTSAPGSAATSRMRPKQTEKNSARSKGTPWLPSSDVTAPTSPDPPNLPSIPVSGRLRA